MAGTKRIQSLSVEASTEHLAEVRDFVAAHAENIGLSQKDISEIRLAVDEAYTNIIKHAYKNSPTEKVEIEIGSDTDHLWISLMDKGKSFDPNSYSEPDLMKRIKAKKRGGMGVYLIRKVMDHVQYNRKGQINEIRMVKNL
ncbi:MAG: ATP-binding protein [Gracilimonas sp.]|uniref:ATP-binding protein n=1 Tax=Gracilimonas sp. TaxID=1974203 RepID=UPI00198F124A|nr:ATP-binding protein [Gracilimonas sp.]MBD3617506.1 ATP-binding protein [Gracilimonas sp.]